MLTDQIRQVGTAPTLSFFHLRQHIDLLSLLCEVLLSEEIGLIVGEMPQMEQIEVLHP